MNIYLIFLGFVEMLTMFTHGLGHTFYQYFPCAKDMIFSVSPGCFEKINSLKNQIKKNNDHVPHFPF